MLVLSRKTDESIFIGDDIEVMIVEIRGDKVRLGVKAPANLPVHRQEVYEAIKAGGQLSETIDRLKVKQNLARGECED
jgi:carbon storage regulator